MLVLSTKPLQKLTGTDRQADRQAGGLTNLGVGRHAPPKKSFEVMTVIRMVTGDVQCLGYSDIQGMLTVQEIGTPSCGW